MLQKLSRYFKVATLITATAFLNIALVTNTSDADIADFAESTKEMTIGKKDAPLTIIEYASLGCSHCAKFHQETYPVLKKDYIDTNIPASVNEGSMEISLLGMRYLKLFSNIEIKRDEMILKR